MTVLKVSAFFNSKNIPPLVLGAFFSRRIFTANDKYILTYSSFKESQKVCTQNIPFDGYYEKYISILNQKSQSYPYWYSKSQVADDLKIKKSDLQGQAVFVLENDLNLTTDNFYNKMYSYLISTYDWLFDEELNSQKEDFIRGFMELRGSIDTKRPYITQDYFYDSKLESKKARFLVDYLSIPFNVININFRELQNQYYSGIVRRNTQFRLDVIWYMENIGLLNGYKAEISSIAHNFTLKKQNEIYYSTTSSKGFKSKSNILDERLNFYSTNIFDKDINDDEIQILRAELGFDDTPKNIRNYALAELIRMNTPDECICCKNKYNIADRSYISKRTGRYYFEIHHVISIGNNRQLDDENNMVKLCPVCHRNLKQGSGTKETQIELIREIYQNAPNTLDFAKQFFDTDDFETIIEKTYLSLN